MIRNKHISRYGSSHLFVGVCKMQNGRMSMEDEYSVKLWNDGRFFIGVFDGHGGDICSKYASENLHKEFVDSATYLSKKIIQNKCIAFDNKCQFSSGSTAAFVYGSLHPYKSSYCNSGVVVSSCNIGDSRIIIVTKKHIWKSKDHTAAKFKEKWRIWRAGYKIRNNRINGKLEISRAFGDTRYKYTDNDKYKYPAVSAKPTVTDVEINEKSLIIQVTDGITNVMSTKEIVDYVLIGKKFTHDLGLVASMLCERAAANKSYDNTTCIITQLYVNGKRYVEKYDKYTFIPGVISPIKYELSHKNMNEEYIRIMALDVLNNPLHLHWKKKQYDVMDYLHIYDFILDRRYKLLSKIIDHTKVRHRSVLYKIIMMNRSNTIQEELDVIKQHFAYIDKVKIDYPISNDI